ncbi:MAG TPA: ATP-binding protein, partial [Gemmatimonadaceae bacterium]|nr:ATP-binding protein [Gemmatimonadaceae bacterium]
MRVACALGEIISRINGARDLDATVTLIARHATELLGGSGARVGLTDQDELTVVAGAGVASGDVGIRAPVNGTLGGDCVRLKRPLRSNRLSDDAERWPWSACNHPAGVENAVAAPLLREGRAIGAIMVFGNTVRDFTTEDEELLMTLAHHATIAIENAQVIREAEQARRQARLLAESERRKRDEFATAAALARIALAAESLPRAADAMLSEIARIVPHAGLALAARTSGSNSDPAFSYVAARGSVHDLLGKQMTGAPESGAIQPWRGASGVMLPLASERRRIGALGIVIADGSAIGDVDREALERLAPAIALAVDSVLMREEDRRQQGWHRLLATALATLNQPVFVCSADESIRYANVAATTAYGHSLAEMLGHPLRMLLAHADGFGPWHSGEQIHRRTNGTEFYAAVMVTPIQDEDGQPLGLVAATRDLSDERRVAEQLRQSERMVALGELVAGVAHELNNPLMGISAFAQILAEESLTSDQSESVQYIKREVDRAMMVVRDLLAFARKSEPGVAAIDINDIVGQTLRLRAYGLRTSNVDVRLALAPTLRCVQGDERQLQQVLLNLIVNAEQAMASTSTRRLTITTADRGDRVCIDVRDSGSGMSADIRQRIFEPFFTTKPEGTGTGLGLSVSYGIVQSHGGSLSVESSPGAGTTFRISLPVA